MMHQSVRTTLLVLLCITLASCAQDAGIKAKADADQRQGQSKNSTMNPNAAVFAAATCQGYRLSGADVKTSLEGTYTKMSLSNKCNNKPVYRFYSSGFKEYVYLYSLSTPLGSSRWVFGDIKCSSYVYARALNTGESEPSRVKTWQEVTTEGTWETVYNMRVACVTSLTACYSCSGSGSSCITSQFSTLDQTTYCDIGAGYYCWESYTTFAYGSTTVKRECKLGCPSSKRYSYSCSRSCTSGSCSKCCTTSLCNDDSMISRRASYGCFGSTYGTASKVGSPAWQVAVLSAVAVCLLTLVVDG